MRAEPDGPSTCLLREPTIQIVLARLVSVEFRPASTLTPALAPHAPVPPDYTTRLTSRPLT
jgi:hypothetical protein